MRYRYVTFVKKSAMSRIHVVSVVCVFAQITSGEKNMLHAQMVLVCVSTILRMIMTSQIISDQGSENATFAMLEQYFIALNVKLGFVTVMTIGVIGAMNHYVMGIF